MMIYILRYYTGNDDIYTDNELRCNLAVPFVQDLGDVDLLAAHAVSPAEQ